MQSRKELKSRTQQMPLNFLRPRNTKMTLVLSESYQTPKGNKLQTFELCWEQLDELAITDIEDSVTQTRNSYYEANEVVPEEIPINYKPQGISKK